MTTIISKNEQNMKELYAKAFTLKDGDMLLTASPSEIDEAGEWMGINGVSGVYFDPESPIEKYSDFMFVLIGPEMSAIRLYN
jgi:hypothetical protein